MGEWGDDEVNDCVEFFLFHFGFDYVERFGRGHNMLFRILGVLFGVCLVYLPCAQCSLCSAGCASWWQCIFFFLYSNCFCGTFWSGVEACVYGYLIFLDVSLLRIFVLKTLPWDSFDMSSW